MYTDENDNATTCTKNKKNQITTTNNENYIITFLNHP